MTILHDLRYIELTEEHVDLARRMAELSTLRGDSEIVSDPDLRAEYADQHNRTGQLGRIALSLWLTGDVKEYLNTQGYVLTYQKGMHLEAVRGTNVIAKASDIHGDSRQPLWRYHLAVRPRSRMPGGVYVLCLAPPLNRRIVVLAGYATDEMLPREPDKSGDFSGAPTLLVPQLHPCMPVRWPGGIEVKVCPDALIAEIERATLIPADLHWEATRKNWSGWEARQLSRHEDTVFLLWVLERARCGCYGRDCETHGPWSAADHEQVEEMIRETNAEAMRLEENAKKKKKK